MGEYVEIVVNDVFNLFVEGMKCEGKRNSLSSSLVVDWNQGGFLCQIGYFVHGRSGDVGWIIAVVEKCRHFFCFGLKIFICGTKAA